MYSPPALGKVAPNSPNESAPQNAIIPPTIQRRSINPGFPRKSIKYPVVVKIPAPIIFAITIFVTVNNPILRSSFLFNKFKIQFFGMRFRKVLNKESK